MESIVGVILFIVLFLVLRIVKQSFDNARSKKLFDTNVTISKKLFDSICEVDFLMNDAPSVSYQKQHLPSALSTLNKEVLKEKRKEVIRELKAKQI